MRIVTSYRLDHIPSRSRDGCGSHRQDLERLPFAGRLAQLPLFCRCGGEGERETPLAISRSESSL